MNKDNMSKIDPTKYLKYPVKYDGMCFFLNGDGHIVGDFNGTLGCCKNETKLRMRGWGWLSNLWKKNDPNDPADIQDSMAEFIAEAINEKLLREKKNLVS